MNINIKSALVIGSVVAASAANANIMIDDFSTGNVSNSLTTGFQYWMSAAAVPGGDRLTYVEVQNNAFGLQMEVDVVTGIFSVNSESGVDGIGAVGYGYNLVNPTSTSFDDLNLNLSSENAFAIRSLSRDGDVAIRVTVRSGANSFSVTQNLVGSAINVPTINTFNFSSFTGINFADVDQIVVDFDTANSVDIAVDYIEAVPEPGTMAVLGAAAAIAAARRRRK